MEVRGIVLYYSSDVLTCSIDCVADKVKENCEMKQSSMTLSFDDCYDLLTDRILEELMSRRAIWWEEAISAIWLTRDLSVIVYWREEYWLHYYR